MNDYAPRSTLADDPDLAPLVEIFLTNLPLRQKAFHEALARGAYSDVARLAHQMAGAAGGYGFDRLSELAVTIEDQAKLAREANDVAAALRAFDQYCERAIQCGCR